MLLLGATLPVGMSSRWQSYQYLQLQQHLRFVLANLVSWCFDGVLMVSARPLFVWSWCFDGVLMVSTRPFLGWAAFAGGVMVF